MLANFLKQWNMFRDLWGVVSADCRGQLIGEFIFNPEALERRWIEEKRFGANLSTRWNRPEPPTE